MRRVGENVDAIWARFLDQVQRLAKNLQGCNRSHAGDISHWVGLGIPLHYLAIRKTSVRGQRYGPGNQQSHFDR